MRVVKLGVNIDHVATLRNARGGTHPEPVRAAKVAEAAGADVLTVHLREDRRHILDHDVVEIKQNISIPLNLEMAPSDEMVRYALQLLPNEVCLVPERREELTTESGLSVAKSKEKLSRVVSVLKGAGIRVAIFVDPKLNEVRGAHDVGADIVELHTGYYCNASGAERVEALGNIKDAAEYAASINIECNAGHGLTNDTIHIIKEVPQIKTLHIGHFIVSEAIFEGLGTVVGSLKKDIASALIA